MYTIPEYKLVNKENMTEGRNWTILFQQKKPSKVYSNTFLGHSRQIGTISAFRHDSSKLFPLVEEGEKKFP